MTVAGPEDFLGAFFFAAPVAADKFIPRGNDAVFSLHRM